MESSDSLPSHTEDDQRGSTREDTTRRVHNGQRLVDRMPINPKRAVFESTQERFEVPLRPDTWSSHAVAGGPGSFVQMPPGPSMCEGSESHDPIGHILEDGRARGRKKAACLAAEGVHRKKQLRSSLRHPKEKNKAPDNSRRLTDYFVTRQGTEGRPISNRSAKPSQSLNIRCNPSDVIFTTQLLNHSQYAAIEALGFGHLLRMQIDAVQSSDLLVWIMDSVSPDDMIIRIGPGKVLHITPTLIHMVLGLTKGGSTLQSFSRTEAVQFQKQLISDLNQECLSEGDQVHISNLQEEILKGRVDSLFMRCFFIIVFDRLLLPTSSSDIDSSNISKAFHPELFTEVDLSQIVFNDLQAAVKRWHRRNKEQSTQTIYGCALFLIVLYLDNLDHPLSPSDWVSMPRVRFYNNAIIHSLTIVDRAQGRDGSRSYGSLMFKRRSCTCYGSVPVDNDGLDDMTNIHQICVPRMRDLLSRPLSRLRGQPLQGLLEVLDQIDLTISENTSAIQASLNNIIRAPIHLADKLRPVIYDLIAAQTSSPNDMLFGEASRRNNRGNEDDFVDSHTDHAQGQDGYLSPVATTRHENPDRNDPSHSIVRPSSRNSNMEIEPHEAGCSSHVNQAATEADFALPSDVSRTLHVPNTRTEGKRLTRKPAKFCSPFKAGMMTRPLPNMDAALNLHAYLCTADSMLRSTPVIQFGSTPLTGASIAQSFSVDASLDSTYMSGFLKCLTYDDYFIRPECHGYRIYLDFEVSAVLNVEWTKRDTSDPIYSHVDAVAAIRRCLPFCNLKKTKMILLPVLYQHHWSVYCVNLDQSRIDVLDSRDYSSQGQTNYLAMA